MLSLLLLVLTITVSAIVIRVGTVALELTGLREEQAYFQALSAFSGVGYTTREAEFVINHPERRKIVRTLIWLGSAGVITSIATLAGTIVSGKSLVNSLTKESYFSWAPLNPAQLTLALLVLFFLVIYLLIRNRAVSRLLKEIISFWLVSEEIVQPVHFQELTSNSLGYGLVRLTVSADSPLLNKSQDDLQLREREVRVLSVERAAESLVYPPAGFKFRQDDLLMCFGPSAAIEQACGLRSSVGTKERDEDESLLKIGSFAPDFILNDQLGREFQLYAHLQGKAVVVFFYPKDHSHVCSQMFVDYSGQTKGLTDGKVKVIAINPASEANHLSFCESTSATITVLSDKEKAVAREYGALALGGLLIDRTVYVVGPDKRIIFASRGHPPAQEVLAIAHKAVATDLA